MFVLGFVGLLMCILVFQLINYQKKLEKNDAVVEWHHA